MKSYCVRPNSGKIEAGQEVEVQGTRYLSSSCVNESALAGYENRCSSGREM